MSVFSGAVLHFNQLNDNLLYETMKIQGEGYVMYGMLNEIRNSSVTIPIVTFLIYLSYVTAADSNISAISQMSENKTDIENAEASIGIKIVWGAVIGGLTYIMLATKGLDGIRILSVLGGFPALFVIIAAGFTLLRILFNKEMVER